MARKLTQEEFIQKAKEKFPNLDYSKTVYKTRMDPITVICPIHGEQTYTNVNNFLSSKYGCLECAKLAKYKQISEKTRMTKEQFIQKAQKKFGGQYDYSKVEYINNDTKVIIICPIHGEFEIRPGDFLRQTGCPKCKPKSLRENFIENWLKSNSVNHIKQYCIILEDNRKAFIDFVINDTYVEYNGIQHYKDVKFFKNGGHKKIPFSLKRQQERDNLVQKYCDNNHINIIWLNYQQSDEEIISELKKII